MATLHEVERYLIEVALARGWISRTDLARAAKFRQKQTDGGRNTTLLRVLRPFVSPATYAQLEAEWAKALKSPTVPKVNRRSWGGSSRDE